nr:hypothetical protein [uncultured Acetatifactor sp.]
MNEHEDITRATEVSEATTDLLVSRTPFRLEDGWEMVPENRNTSCSHAEIETLIQKRILNLIDLEIMKILAAYHYLNHHNIRLELEQRLHPGYRKESYSDNLRKMKRAGILLCFIPVPASPLPGASPIPGTSPVPAASPLKLYCLSTAAFSYMAPLTEAHPILPSSARRKIELAAAGQFLIQFLKHYKDSVIGYEYEKGTKIGNAPFLLDAAIRYRATVPGLPEAQTVTIFLLALRRCTNWEKAALSRLSLFRIWLSRHGGECMLPLPVLLVEDIEMALQLYVQMQAAESLSGLHAYFCPDSLLMAVPPLQTLHQCKTDGDGKVVAIRTDLTK